MLVIDANKEDIVLDWVLCIYYPIWFKKNKIQALIDFDSKKNAMILVYTSKLDFKVHQINVKAQKIDYSILKTF